MQDIEDLPRCLHMQRGEKCESKGLSRHNASGNMREKCAVCPHYTAGTTSGATTNPTTTSNDALNRAMKGEWIEADSTYPIENPYGEMVSMDQLLQIREAQRAPQRAMLDKIRSGEIRAPNARLQYNLTGEIPKEWPLETPHTAAISPYAMLPEVDDIIRPIIHRFVENLKNKTTDMPFPEPFITNGYATYKEENRFQTEVDYIKSNYIWAGLSSDVLKANDFVRIEMSGKSILLTRDVDMKFHAFENVCRHRGMEVVQKENPRGNTQVHVCPYHSWAYGSDGDLLNVPFEQGFDNNTNVDLGNRNLIELPSAEIAGILFVVSHPKNGIDYELLKENIMNSDLIKELSTYQVDKNFVVVSQEMFIKANWKLPIDTFGEAYHFSSLHPGLSEQLVGNSVIFRWFDDKNGKAQHSCMTLGSQSLQLMADGHVPKERWLEPCGLSHCTQTFVIAPNTSMIVSTDGVRVTQAWPGKKVDECIVKVTMYNYKVPETDQDRVLLNNRFGQFMDVVCTEDFPILHQMQRSFAESKDAETIFGKHEPALIYRHKMFLTMLEGSGKAKL